MQQPVKKKRFKWWRRIKRDILTKRVRSAFLLLVMVVIYKNWGLEASVFWSIFLAFAFYDWDNRILGGLALFCLATCPLLLAYQQDDSAELMAIYAYYFLVMTVVLQVIEYKRHPELFSQTGYEEK